MVGWQRNLRVLLRHVGTRVEQHQRLPVNTYSIHVKPCTLLPGRSVYRGFDISSRYAESLSQRHIQFSGFFTSRNLLADVDGKLVPISSPLTPPSPTSTEKSERAVISKREKVQAVLKGIRQSPKKVNLVARLVRGMPVEDALLQLQVTVKRAAKTVYKVIKSARANASHNHGLDADRLLVEEAFVGKGLFLKRLSYHAKGRCGVMIRPHCRLTVVVREMTAEEETKIAKLKVMNYKRLTRKEKQLVPHQLIETTPRWSRRPKVHSSA